MLLDINQIEKKEAYYAELKTLIKERTEHNCIGFWGQPDQETMDIFAACNFKFIDLDIPRDNNACPSFVPQTICQIIQNIMANTHELKDSLDFIVATTGDDKCEQGRNAAAILSNEGFRIINATNTNRTPIRPCLLSNAAVPLRHRINRIMELIYSPLTKEEEIYYTARQIQEPAFVFHGVPPADLSLLELFPSNTRIEGWTKLVELGIPGRTDLEWQIDPQFPTVFFTQSFCHKELPAVYWAKQRGGLHIEAHGAITSSTEAKLQAYLGLAGKSFPRSSGL